MRLDAETLEALGFGAVDSFDFAALLEEQRRAASRRSYAKRDTFKHRESNKRYSKSEKGKQAAARRNANRVDYDAAYYKRHRVRELARARVVWQTKKLDPVWLAERRKRDLARYHARKAKMRTEDKKAREEALRARLEFFKSGGTVFGEPPTLKKYEPNEGREYFIKGFEEAMRTLGVEP